MEWPVAGIQLHGAPEFFPSNRTKYDYDIDVQVRQ